MVLSVMAVRPIGGGFRLSRTFHLPVRIPSRELIHCTVPDLRRFEITKIDSHHLQRRRLTTLSRQENHREMRR